MLTEIQKRKLARCYNRRTLYEATIIRPDGAKVLLAYVQSANKRGLRDAVWKRGQDIVSWLNAPADAEMTWKRGSTDMQITGGGIVHLSGRTQREAIIEGELPYVGNAAKE